MIVLLGPPGCGKGTVATFLYRNHQYLHLSTGDLCRINSNPENNYEKTISEGTFIDNTVMNGWVKEYILTLHDDKKKNLILDGYPRTGEQAMFLETLGGCDIVIFIDIPEDVCINRICNRNEGRPDDNFETAKLRWDQYIRNTRPLIEYYEKKGLLRRIDGTKTKEDVLKEVLKFL